MSRLKSACGERKLKFKIFPFFIPSSNISIHKQLILFSAYRNNDSYVKKSWFTTLILKKLWRFVKPKWTQNVIICKQSHTIMCFIKWCSLPHPCFLRMPPFIPRHDNFDNLLPKNQFTCKKLSTRCIWRFSNFHSLLVILDQRVWNRLLALNSA